MASENLGMVVHGHLICEDDLGNVLIDEGNAVHPQNLARVFSRALSNEYNDSIYRLAIGDGGTVTDAAFNITYRSPNDGQPPDVRTWDSRLYNEIYSEIIDEGTFTEPNPNIGVDPGSAGPNVGTRPGGSSFPANDPTSTPNVSGPGVRSIEDGLISRVLIISVLNSDEPTGHLDKFSFDEIGLYTSGAPAIGSTGYQNIGYGDKFSTSDSGLVATVPYDFTINVDGLPVEILFTPPISGGSGAGGEFLYGDLCEALNTGDVAWNSTWSPPASPLGNARISISDGTTTLFPSISGADTNGFLLFESGTSGVSSSVSVTRGTINDLFAALGIIDDSGIGVPVDGVDAGLQNSPSSHELERERLLTHLIFEPVVRPPGRQLTFTYTLYVSVARTPE